MKWSRMGRWSIKTKLISIVFGVTAASLLSFASFTLVREIRTFRQDLVHRMTATARLLGDYSIVDLTFRDQTASSRTLRTLAVEPVIRSAMIFEADGSLFSEYHGAGVLPVRNPPLPARSQHIFQKDRLDIFQLILDADGQFYGTIYFQVSTEQLQQKIRDSVLALAVVFLLVLAAAVLLAVHLQRIISGPILALAATARKVSEGQGYAVRAEKSGEDELGFLSEGFNQMLTTIESRDQQREFVETALRESEARYRSLVESSPDGILVEREGKIVYVNPSALRLLGYKSGKELRDLQLRDILGRDFTSVKDSGTPSPQEKKLVGRNGQEFDVEVSFIPTTFEKETAIQWILRDITERKNMAIATLRMERLAALGEFSATTAHEIRNSLGSISLNFHNLSEHMTIPENLKRTFANIEHGIQRIQTTIKGILEFTRPSLPVFRKVDIHKVIESSLRSVDEQLKQNEISIVRNLQAENSVVRVDPNQMIQVFTNLFTNSLQAMENGGQLSIETENVGQEVKVVVGDTGKGIREDHLSKIFDPFFTTRTSGTGLGLAVVARILEQHKIRIQVGSRDDSGTRVTLTVPAVLRDQT